MRSKKTNPYYAKVLVPDYRVLLPPIPEVKMKGEENLVKVKEAVAATIDNLRRKWSLFLALKINTSPEWYGCRPLQSGVVAVLSRVVWLPCARTRHRRTCW